MQDTSPGRNFGSMSAVKLTSIVHPLPECENPLWHEAATAIGAGGKRDRIGLTWFKAGQRGLEYLHQSLIEQAHSGGRRPRCPAGSHREQVPWKCNSAAGISPTMRELLKEGLRLRQEQGVAAAIPLFERASQLEPNSHLPFFMLGNAISELGDLDAAVRHFVRARDLQPREPAIRFNLGLRQLWRGYIDAAIEELEVACRLNPDYLPAQSTYMLALHSSDRTSAEEIAATARRWGVRFARQHPAAVWSGHGGLAARPERLRVGFISGDFRRHSVAHFFLPIAHGHDRDAFTYVFYNTSRDHDELTEGFRSDADEWRDVVQLSDAALIQLIGADRIDVLVDLSGHTAFNRLAVFARRAARVQVSYLGYPDSTGLPTMDYRITDGCTDPQPLADSWHSERLLRLPDAQWCFRPFGTPLQPGPLPARAAGFVTFGSFNLLSKAGDTLLRCWAQILLNSTNSRLRLARIRSPERAAEIVAMLGQAGVAPERVDCIAESAVAPHGSQFSGVDIVLDHYPYNGVTTTCESLYSGVPVISMHGRTCASRSGLSLLGSLGLTELIASTPQQYVESALALAGDPTRLEQLRASLRARFEKSSLRDERRFATHFGELLNSAWHGNSPP
jgi:protein O-GlcNAc transferase